jgi:hypothetical protein
MKIFRLFGHMPSEFKTQKDIGDLFNRYELMPGRMISGSKSYYRDSYPDHTVVFNGNIVTKKRGKIWYGDLDVTLDFDNLKGVADELGEDLYILREMDARFDNENAGFKYWKSKAIAIIKCKK